MAQMNLILLKMTDLSFFVCFVKIVISDFKNKNNFVFKFLRRSIKST